MRICVLGKRGSVVGWVEGAVAGWRTAGHTVLPVIYRDTRMFPALEQALFSELVGAPRAVLLARRIRAFAPDLIVAPDAFSAPPSLLARIRRIPDPPPMIGWVGDLFGEPARQRAAYFDAVGYTDSGLVALHSDMSLPTDAFFLPHAANPLLGEGEWTGAKRRPRLVFVGHPTPERLATVRALRQPVDLHGPGWDVVRGGVHVVNARRIPLGRVGSLYRAHAAVLNIRNEKHVLNGLNQRHFDAFLCGAALISDPQTDLDHCFDIGSEVVVWREPAEIDAISARLRSDPDWAARLAANGRKRVLAEHTYAARLLSLIRIARIAV
jgi:spore maturation protein CgeB